MADDFLTPKTGRFKQSAAPLIAALETALKGHRTPREERYLQQLAQRVAETGATEAIPILLQYTLSSKNTQALTLLLSTTTAPLSPLPTPLLIEMLAVVVHVEVDTALAATIAEVLVTKAEKERTSEFAPVLPLLPKSSLHFLRLRKRLQVALKGNNFPIPAELPREEENLPLPSQESRNS